MNNINSAWSVFEETDIAGRKGLDVDHLLAKLDSLEKAVAFIQKNPRGENFRVILGPDGFPVYHELVGYI